MNLVRSGIVSGIAVCVGWVIVDAVPAPAATLRAPPPSHYTDLRAVAVGDTLEVRVLAHDDVGRPEAGTVITLDVLSEPGPFDPAAAELETDLDGAVRFRLRVNGPPGDHPLLISRLSGPDAPLRIPVRVLPQGWVGRMIMHVAGGLALFLFGMRLLGSSLEKAAGQRLRWSLERMTRSPLHAVLFGMGSTLLVQSSSASTVLLVSFASTGLLSLRAGLGAVLGAGIGSTLTVQLIAFRLADWALLLVAIGFVLTMMEKRKVRRLGTAVLGLGLVFYGLRVMSEALAPLDGLGPVLGFFVAAAENPVPAMLAAAVFTAIAQASAATIGVILGLALEGIIPLNAAVPFVLGASVGTATTALLASLGAPPDGRRIAWAHASFRLGGALLCLPFLGPFTTFVGHLSADPARQVAHAYTLLNVTAAVLFFPFLSAAERFFRRLIPDQPSEEDEFAPRSLDPRFREQPDIAIAGALQEVLRMGQLVKAMLDDVKESLRRDDEALAQSIRDRDDRVDRLDEAITRYLADLNTEDLSGPQSVRVLDLLFVTKDLELIADIISKGLVPGLLRKKRRDGLRFSDEGFRQLLDFHDRVREVVELGVASVATWDGAIARRVLERKSALSALERRLHVDHLERLQAGNEAARATTTVHVDAVNDLKRIVTHVARIAYVVLGERHDLPRDTEVVLGDRSA